MKTDVIKLSFDQQHNEWRMAVNQGVAQGPGHYPTLTVPYNKTGEFSFQILNPQGVTFAATDPFAAKAQQTGKGDFGDQFNVSAGGGQTLTVTDMNGQKLKQKYDGGDYHYALHFSNGTTLDPVVTNGGCCQSGGIGQNAVSYLAIGVVALLVLWVLFLRPKTAPVSEMNDSDQG